MAISDRKWCVCLVNNLLVTLTLVGVAVGITVGILVRQTEPSQDVVIWIGLSGDVYMNSLKMMVLPLIVTSIVTGTASLDPKCNGRISMVSLVYIVTTNSLACLIPIVITLAVEPGKRTSMIGEIKNKQGEATTETIDVFADLIRNFFPSNIISACFEQHQTRYENILPSPSSALNTTEDKNETDIMTQQKVLGTVPSTNVLGLVIFSFILGVATSSIGPAGRAFFVFFHSANDVIMKVLSWLIWATPLGVASLIAAAFLQVENLEMIVTSLGLFCLVTIGCLMLHVTFLAVGIHLVMLRKNPFPFIASMRRAVVVVFATTSTALAIPEILHALEERNDLDKRVTRFAVPLATAINRDGSSIFIAISCVFLAQMSGHNINAAQIIILWTLLTFISMATPSVPSASIVVVSIILSSLGLPTQLVGLLFATEWLLDRLRACVNMVSHGYCTLVVQRLCQGVLSAPVDMKPTQEDCRLLVGDDVTVVDNELPAIVTSSKV